MVLVFTRLWDLGNRSYGHDESIHAWEAWKLVTGQGYQHDPVYHGPFGYHVVAFIFFLFGITDTTARLAPALFGIALVLLVLPLRRWLGRGGTLAAMLLVTLSPTLMYRSRYFRHDIWLMVAEMVMVVSFFRYLAERKERWLYLIAGSLAVAFASKAIASRAERHRLTAIPWGTSWRSRIVRLMNWSSTTSTRVIVIGY